MITRWAQGAAWMTAMLLFVADICSGAPADGRYARQLRAECRALVADAVSKPYGLAWGDAPAAARGGTAARPVMMDPTATPAAGVILLWSAELLGDQSLRDAATRAAAGVVAAQSPSGFVVPVAVFGESTGLPGDTAPHAGRSSTAAGMALLLAVHDSQQTKDATLARSIEKASSWLREQQLPLKGGWPRADVDGATVVRLDDADYRNCTYAMLLDAALSRRPEARAGADSALEFLGQLQLTETSELLPGTRLWTTRYDLDGKPQPTHDRPADTADLLATRFALQTIFAAAVVSGERSKVAELTRAAKRIEKLRRPDGKWNRFSSLTPSNTGDSSIDDFGLASLLDSATAMNNLGPDRYVQLLNRGWTGNAHLVSALIGLNDDAFSLHWPVAGAEVGAYIDRRQDDWKMLDVPPPAQLRERTARLWLLLQRAKLERMQ